MMQFETWSQEDAEREIPKRLKDALAYRAKFEPGWRANEAMLFGSGEPLDSSGTTVSYNALAELFAGDLSSGDSWIAVNYMFKYLRYIHSQMAANPPSVTPRPTSADYADRKAAEVADALVTYGRRQYKIQDRIDLTSLQTLCYGSGFMKVFHDPMAGQVLDVDRAKRTLTMTGDERFKPLLIWDVAFDHTARFWDDVRYTFERHVLSLEEAQFRWPKSKDKLAQYANQQSRAQFWDNGPAGDATTGRVAVWEYVEAARPWNGMAGRRMFLLQDGTALSDVTENPHPDGALPINILTDIDVPGQVYGKSFCDYLIRLQDVLNRLDSTVLDNIQAHGTVRMVVYDAAETGEDQPTNSGWEIVNMRGTAAQKPDFIDPPTLMPDIYKFRDQLVTAMEQLAGVNESMFGQVKREMSGFSLQTAINAGNTVRRRLYNKYEAFVEWAYETFLANVRKYWNDRRKILVTGEEGALAVAYYSGADIESGFDLDVQYGASFSLDPAQRREEILQIMPLLKEAGMSIKSILKLLRLNDISTAFDMATMSQRRQLEIFDEIISKYEETGVLVRIQPRDLEEHQGMLSAAYEFVMSMAYKVLDPKVKALIDEHIKAREAKAAEAATSPAAEAGALPPGGGPAPAGPATEPALDLGLTPA